MAGIQKFTAERAIAALGLSRPTWELKHMRAALSIHSMCNTDDDNERLRACRWALANNKAYEAACDAKRKASFVEMLERSKLKFDPKHIVFLRVGD